MVRFLPEAVGGHTPEEGQVLGELDDLLHHERVHVRVVHQQRQHGQRGGQALVVGEQVRRRLQRSEPE